MVDYEVIVHTGDRLQAGSFNNVFIRLVGKNGKSKLTKLTSKDWFNWLLSPFRQGKVSSFTVSCHKSLGKLVSIELNKQRGWIPVDSWFVDKVEITDPEGQTYIFPVYRWINDSEVHCFREGTALRASQETDDQYHSRKWALIQRKKDYRWDTYKDGLPHCVKADSPHSLPSEVKFSFTKTTEFFYTLTTGLLELKLKDLEDCAERWPDMDHFSQVFFDKSTAMSEYVKKYWEDDAFFGYQFINGVNPMIIRRCRVLPVNFPVTDEMDYFHFRSLRAEMREGNIFLCDYKNLDGVKPNTINGKDQYLMAPLVLLHKTFENKLMPIAIQSIMQGKHQKVCKRPASKEEEDAVLKSYRGLQAL